MKRYYPAKVEDESVTSAPYSRFRERGLITWAPVNYRSWYRWDQMVPQPAMPALSADSVSGLYETMTDFVTPRFKEFVSLGKIVNTSMSKTSTSWAINKSASCYFRNSVQPTNNYHWNLQGMLLTTRPKTLSTITSTIGSLCSTLAAPDIPTMRALAATEARANIAQPDFEGLVSLGEMTQTLRLLANPFRTGLKLASQLERKIGRMQPSRAVHADLASLYLEFRYGVRPLVKEVENALVNLVAMGFSFDRKTARASQKFTSEDLKTTLVNYGSNVWYDETIKRERKYSVRNGFLYQTDFSVGSANQWGTRLSDIPTALWELVPLSFVYDWVGNVGDFIGALTPRAGVNILSQWTTTEDTTILTMTGGNYRILNEPGWSTVVQSSCEQVGTITIKNRSPVVQAPSIAWRGFDKVSSDAFKILDLIGIFGQKLHNAASLGERKLIQQDALVRSGKRLTARVNKF